MAQRQLCLAGGLAAPEKTEPPPFSPYLSTVHLHFTKLPIAEIELVKSGDTFSKQEMELAVEGLAKAGNFKLFVDDAEVIAFKTNKNGKAAIKFSDKNAKK